MSFSLSAMVKGDEGYQHLTDFSERAGTAANPAALDGFIIPANNNRALIEPVESDPLMHLCTMWMLKVPWVITGDEEVVALRNSPYCYGFEPAGSQVRIYFYEGTEGEVENLLVEPVGVPIKDFVPASLQMGRDMLSWATQCLGEEQEEVVELRTALEEAENAWAEKKREQH
jgi:hypothetical protein